MRWRRWFCSANPKPSTSRGELTLGLLSILLPWQTVAPPPTLPSQMPLGALSCSVGGLPHWCHLSVNLRASSYFRGREIRLCELDQQSFGKRPGLQACHPHESKHRRPLQSRWGWDRLVVSPLLWDNAHGGRWAGEAPVKREAILSSL